MLALDRRTVRALDVALLVWVVAWVAVALQVVREVRGLRELGGGAVSAGVALHRTADALGALRSLPLVGRDIAELERRIDEGAARVERAGRRSRDDVDRLAVFLGIVVAVGPVAPLAAVYLLVRIGWARERRAVSAALREVADTAALDDYLARRAAAVLPFDPSLAAAHGAADTRALADAELERLGLRRPRVPHG